MNQGGSDETADRCNRRPPKCRENAGCTPGYRFRYDPTRDGRRLLITHPASDSVSILNLHSMKVEQVIQVPPDPQEILIRPDDQIAYVSCDESKQVAAIDLSSGR